MSISYNGGTTNLIDHLVSNHGFHRTPLKPPRDDESDSEISSSNSKEDAKSWREQKNADSDKEEVFIRSDKDYDYWGPTNNPQLPEPYVTYTAIRDLHTNAIYRAFSKVEIRGNDKWFILCLASQKLLTTSSTQTSPKIKTEKDMKEMVAFVMNADTKDIQKECLSKLKYLKGNISAELKREANAAIDNLYEWIAKNDNNNCNNEKKRPKDGNNQTTLVKKESYNDFTEEQEKKIIDRFASPERKRPKKPMLDSTNNNTSPETSPRTITTPPLVLPSVALCSPNHSNSKLSPDKTINYKIPLLSKRRTVTIAPPEPPQPLDQPKDD